MTNNADKNGPRGIFISYSHDTNAVFESLKDALSATEPRLFCECDLEVKDIFDCKFVPLDICTESLVERNLEQSDLAKFQWKRLQDSSDDCTLVEDSDHDCFLLKRDKPSETSTILGNLIKGTMRPCLTARRRHELSMLGPVIESSAEAMTASISQVFAADESVVSDVNDNVVLLDTVTEMHRSQAIIVILSTSESKRSSWVEQEIEFLNDRESKLLHIVMDVMSLPLGDEVSWVRPASILPLFEIEHIEDEGVVCSFSFPNLEFRSPVIDDYPMFNINGCESLDDSPRRIWKISDPVTSKNVEQEKENLDCRSVRDRVSFRIPFVSQQISMSNESRVFEGGEGQLNRRSAALHADSGGACDVPATFETSPQFAPARRDRLGHRNNVSNLAKSLVEPAKPHTFH